MTNDDSVEKYERPRPPELIYCKQLVKEIIKRNGETDRPLTFGVAKDKAIPMTINGPLTVEKKEEVGAAFMAEMEAIKEESLKSW